MSAAASPQLGAAASKPRCFAFVFPMASGHINPSLPIARALVKLGHEVHYLCREQMRKAIEGTGATFHSELETLPEMYSGREPSYYAALDAVKREHGMAEAGMMAALGNLREVCIELMLPGLMRWLRTVGPSAVLYCPLMSPEAPTAAKALGIPRVSVLTFAGPGSVSKMFADLLAVEGLTPGEVMETRRSFKPLRDCFERVRAEYGVDFHMSNLYDPVGRIEAIIDSDVTLVTTCEALQDPAPAELTQLYEDLGVKFAYVGPLLDAEGACRAGGHKFRGEGEQQHGDATEQQDPAALVRAARAAGRRVILASMGTVITGDSTDWGWDARLCGPDGQRKGLTGRELCQAAWGGAFDAFGAGGPEQGPLILVALGSQPDALGSLVAPPNAICVPVLPQVDVLKAGVDLFLTHGGQNSFTESLAVGTPMVVCPGFGDQVVNAQKAVHLGVGLKVDRPMPEEGEEGPAAAAYRAEAAAALRRAFEEQGFREAAEECSQQLRAAGGVPRAVELVLSVSSEPAATDAEETGAVKSKEKASAASIAGA